MGVQCNLIQLFDGYKVRQPVLAWQLHYSGHRLVSPPPTLYTLQQHLHGCLLLFFKLFKLFRLILFVFVVDVAEGTGVGIAIGLGVGHQSLPQPNPPLHQTGSRG